MKISFFKQLPKLITQTITIVCTLITTLTMISSLTTEVNGEIITFDSTVSSLSNGLNNGDSVTVGGITVTFTNAVITNGGSVGEVENSGILFSSSTEAGTSDVISVDITFNQNVQITSYEIGQREDVPTGRFFTLSGSNGVSGNNVIPSGSTQTEISINFDTGTIPFIKAGESYTLSHNLPTDNENDPLFNLESLTVTAIPEISNWQKQTSPATQNIQEVRYFNNLFIAVGNGGAIITSPDGKIWSLQSSQTSNDLNGIAFEKGRYIALGKNIIITSTDAVNWSPITTDINSSEDNLYDILYNNGEYILAAFEYIATSTDLTNWNIIRENTGSYNLVKIDGIFYYSGENGDVQASLDARNWFPRLENNCYVDNIITHGGNLFTVGCKSSPTFGSVVYRSTNGEIWDEISNIVSSSSIFSGLASGNNYLIIVGSGGAVRISVDGGNTWGDKNIAGEDTFSPSIAYGNNRFVIVGDSGVIYLLEDMDSVDFEISSQINNAVNISWDSSVNKKYSVEFRNDLKDDNWIKIQQNIQGDGSTLSVYDLINNSDTKFYRVLESDL